METAEEKQKEEILVLSNIWKSFSGVSVLKGVNMTLREGEIHALLGGNGSGKSTLMKIVSGIYGRDAGTILVDGEEVVFQNPSQAHLGHIYLVPQEPQIFPHLSIEENVILGTGCKVGDMTREIVRIGEALGFCEDLSELAGALSIAQQQLLEIIRGLIRKARVLILDEPTSTLTFKEVNSLFERLKVLKSQGIGIFFISHRLNEILEISDRVSVLRDGNMVLCKATSKLDHIKLVKAMLPEGKAGREEPCEEKRQSIGDETVFELHDFSSEDFKDISLNVKSGEIVGLAGVVGAGRTELAEAVMGITGGSEGRVCVSDKELAVRTPGRCQESGLVYVPEDRAAHGIFLGQPNYFTTTSSILRRFGKVFMSSGKEYGIAKRFIEQFRIKVAGPDQVASTLSGGNQQKVVLSRVIACDPSVIILDEPTRGVDAEARLDVYKIIRSLTAQGVGVLLISSDLEEILELSDRIYIMYHGQITGEYARSECDIETVTAGAFGVQGSHV
ncbi:sugar ABC transporter ATP-binding protein [Sediminispirochaeta bajacaliforniensis]|uniref:sugar ABC transporter ATP-binding protein n=1 Tax=Sediminispirochaeta bajacaliforniensis TaxID=148 RepID=UPI000370C261|nr:sugar ABC transporter ATP-binding protein [Sediminispirochaeta bajacaliforniensis]